MTPKELFNDYVKEICTHCTKNVDCELHITVDNEVQCTS